MRGTSSIYAWQGGASDPHPERPECSKKTHARLIEGSGKMLFDARKASYAWYCKECRAWGREPADEENWFMHAKMVYCRLQRGEKNRKSAADGDGRRPNARERRLRAD